MATRPQVSIRLATDGKAQVQRDFDDIAISGDAAAKRYQAAWERASAAATDAIEREAKAAERLASISASPLQQQINRSTGVGNDTGNARASAQALAQQLDAAEREARQLIAAIDPLFAAQARYEAQVERINAVKATGQLSEERYQQLLATEKLRLDEASAAAIRHGNASGTMRMGMQQLSFQIGDISQQMALGVSGSRIFIQQSGQVIQALQIMGGQGNAFLRFLGGPWGLALSTAAVALVPLIGKLLDTGTSIDDLVDKLKKEAREAANNDAAHRAFATTLDGVNEALRKNRDALKGLADQGKTAAEQALAQAKAQLVLAETNKFAADSELRYAKALLERKRAAIIGPETKGRPDPAMVSFNQAADAEMKTLDDLGDPAAWQDAINRAKQAITEAESRIAVEAGMRDAADRIKRLYEGPDGLIEKTRQRLVNEKATTAEIERQVRALHDREEAEVKAAQAKEREHRPAKNAGGTEIFDQQIGRFFDIAARYRGMSETANKGVLEQFFREANQQLDPEKTAWCAAFVNAVLAAGGATGTGSLAARSFLNFGKDDTRSPQRGDIVIVRSDASASGTHVGFLDSIDAKGNVRVLGGNTGNKVGSASYGASDVLGIRRPPTPAEAYADQLSIADAMDRKLADGMAKDQQIAILKENQRDYARELLDATGATLDTVDRILPSLEAWKREYEQIKASVDEFRQFGDDVLDELLNPDNWNDWGDLGKRVLKEIEQELIKLTLLNPLKNWLNGENNPTLSSLFKGLGSIAGIFGGGIGSPSTSGFSVGINTSNTSLGIPISTLGGNAIGSDYYPGGATWVGEFGKELVTLPRGSRITPAAESRRIAAANDRGIGTINVVTNIDATGADSAELARTRAELEQLKQDIPARVVEAYYEARSRNMIRAGR